MLSARAILQRFADLSVLLEKTIHKRQSLVSWNLSSIGKRRPYRFTTSAALPGLELVMMSQNSHWKGQPRENFTALVFCRTEGSHREKPQRRHACGLRHEANHVIEAPERRRELRPDYEDAWVGAEDHPGSDEQRSVNASDAAINSELEVRRPPGAPAREGSSASPP